MKNNLITLIKKVSYRKNVILIEFNKNMNININTINIKHSYLNFENYALENEKILKPFPKETKVKEIEFAFSVCFNLPDFFLENIHENAILHLGYINKKNIFYIKNADNEILDLCNLILLGKQVEELNLENGSIEILDNKKLKYSYNGKNAFRKISIEDFSILEGIKIYYPSLIEQISSEEFILTFSNLILNKIKNSIFLKLVEKPRSTDIYGFKIKGNIKISILTLTPTILNSFNFLNYENRIAYFKLQFSKPIKIFDSTDFIVNYNNDNKIINYLGMNNERKIVDIAISNLDINDIDSTIFEIFTGVEPKDVNTVDDNEKIIYVEKRESSLFKSLDLRWTFKDYNFSKSIISIKFNDLILSDSLIKDYSIFEENINSWNGEILTIKPNNVILGYDNNNFLNLSFNKNESFGKILIKSKTNFKVIGLNKIFNKKPCYIYIKSRELFLEFDEKEDMDAILVFIEDFKYLPYNGIKSKGGNFIFYGYSPTAKYDLEDVEYIEPLTNEKDNPFKGENILGNYIVGIHNYNKIRIYGDDLNTTSINGFLRVVGRVENTEIATLQNLNVLGDIIIDSSKINIIFDNIECLGEVIFKIH